MEPLSSPPCSNEHKAQKRPIAFITIESHDDDIVNEVFSSSAVKRGKNETNTKTFEEEASTSAVSLKENGEIVHPDFTAAEVSNASNLTNDAEVQLDENLVQDSLKEQANDKTSAEHFDALNDSENGNNSKSLNIIKAPNFKFEATSKGNKLLSVFDPNDKTICYRFYGNHYGKFHCAECITAHHKTVAAELLKDENGEDYVQMVHPHLCKPVKYVPPSERQQHEIINAPNYELQIKLNGYRKLVIFVATNPNHCYYYQHNRSNYFVCCECKKNYKKHISAKVLTDKEGTQYVQANVPHLCEPVPYIVNKWHTMQAPNFFVPKLNKMLVVFNYDHLNFCYRYFYNNVSKCYNCIRCSNRHGKGVSAKVIKDENGNDCLLVNVKHFCDLFTYKVSDSFDIVKFPNFTLINDETNGSDASMLRIYASNDRSTCYNFTQMGSSYACSECHSQGNHFMAKLFKDENDDDVVLVLKKEKHVCLPIICC